MLHMQALTNKFAVRDVEELIADFNDHGILVVNTVESILTEEHFDIIVHLDDKNDPASKIKLTAASGWPKLSPQSQYEDLPHLVSTHLVTEEVAVFFEINSSNTSIEGSVIAINHTGSRESNHLGNIFSTASWLTTNRAIGGF